MTFSFILSSMSPDFDDGEESLVGAVLGEDERAGLHLLLYLSRGETEQGDSVEGRDLLSGLREVALVCSRVMCGI